MDSTRGWGKNKFFFVDGPEWITETNTRELVLISLKSTN